MERFNPHKHLGSLLKSSDAAFGNQLQKFRKLFFGHCMKSPLGETLALPSAVLVFAEGLMLCPTEESALTHMQRDREGARGCYSIAGDVASEAYAGRAHILIPKGREETPFALLGQVVCLVVQATIDRHGDKWS